MVASKLQTAKTPRSLAGPGQQVCKPNQSLRAQRSSTGVYTSRYGRVVAAPPSYGPEYFAPVPRKRRVAKSSKTATTAPAGSAKPASAGTRKSPRTPAVKPACTPTAKTARTPTAKTARTPAARTGTRKSPRTPAKRTVLTPTAKPARSKAKKTKTIE